MSFLCRSFCRSFCRSSRAMAASRPIRNDAISDTLHGTPVPDPYRPLEDPFAPETAAFVAEQNTKFRSFVSAFTNLPVLGARLEQLTDFPRTGTPIKAGSAYFLFHNTGLQPQSVMYRMRSIEAPRTVFLDPNTLSADGTVAISTYAFSETGNFLAYALSASGSDWVSIHVKQTPKDAPHATSDSAASDQTSDSYEDLPVEWAKFTSIAWTHDDAGYFYTRYPAPDGIDAKHRGTETNASKNPSIYYHRLRTPQSADTLIHTDPDHPDFLPSASVTKDGKYVVLSIADGCKPENQAFVAPIASSSSGSPLAGPFVPISNKFDAHYSVIANDGPVFYLETTLAAPKKRIVKFDLGHPDNGFVEIIPESDAVIDSIRVVDNTRLIIVYLRDVKHVASVFDLASGAPVAPFELPLPESSIIASMSGRRQDSELFYSFSSYLTPGTIYRYDFKTMSHSVFSQNDVKGFRSDELQAKQVFYESKDGTRVPMTIISRKDVVLDGSNPTILYGYGGFNIAITPYFSVQFAAWVQHFRGVVAVANIRGGGEYGEELWYNQGRLKNKQNVFDDFQAAARWLSSNGYARPDKIAINGGSNGGLLVGACINQAPELFGAAVAEVGVLDMYRFHKFTIGSAWISDYGNPDNKDDFEVLRRYSPLHNIQPSREYPAVLIMTGDHDDRVVPLHSHKFVATLQHARPDNKKPILERVETKAGHGAGKSTQQRIKETTDKLAFIALALGAEFYP